MVTEVFLHAGAHRTGTSSFQNMLAINRQVLKAAGYDAAYPGRDGIASGSLRLKLPGPRHGAKALGGFSKDAQEELARHGSKTHRLILSEENIPGRMYHFYYGDFFPSAPKRLEVLADALPAPVRHLVYVIRPYGALYTSGFRKRAEDNAVEDFDELAGNMMAIDQGWPELVAKMAAHLKPQKFTVIDYGARGRSVDLLGHLTGEAIEGLEEPEHHLNQSASDAALWALQDIYRRGETLDRAQWQAIIGDYAQNQSKRQFAGFSPEQTKILDRKYAEDLGRLSQMTGVTLICEGGA